MWLAVMLAGSTVAGPGALSAQGGDGFLFSEPHVTLKFEGGYGWQVAGGDVFNWLVEEQEVSRRNFSAPYLGGELGLGLNEHFQIAIAVGYQRREIPSEYRDWVDTDNNPILQATVLNQIPAVASLKIYPIARGRSIGRFAWVPRAFVPFFGAGAGVLSYSFERSGDFVDPETLDIYPDEQIKQGETFLARAQAGFDVSITKQFLLTLEGRYNFARTPMDAEWAQFQNLDLQGLQLLAGLGVRW